MEMKAGNEKVRGNEQLNEGVGLLESGLAAGGLALLDTQGISISLLPPTPLLDLLDEGYAGPFRAHIHLAGEPILSNGLVKVAATPLSAFKAHVGLPSQIPRLLPNLAGRGRRPGNNRR
jgi:hypothetical protein